MSEIVIFIIGVIIFAITVYGTVMAGGAALTRIEIEQNPNIDDSIAKEPPLDGGFPLGKY